MRIGFDRLLYAFLVAATSAGMAWLLLDRVPAETIAANFKYLSLPIGALAAICFQAISKMEDISKEKVFSKRERERLDRELQKRKSRVWVYMIYSLVLAITLGLSSILIGPFLAGVAATIVVGILIVLIFESLYFLILLAESYREASNFIAHVRDREIEAENMRKLQEKLCNHDK